MTWESGSSAFCYDLTEACVSNWLGINRVAGASLLLAGCQGALHAMDAIAKHVGAGLGWRSDKKRHCACTTHIILTLVSLSGIMSHYQVYEVVSKSKDDVMG